MKSLISKRICIEVRCETDPFQKAKQFFSNDFSLSSIADHSTEYIKLTVSSPLTVFKTTLKCQTFLFDFSNA